MALEKVEEIVSSNTVVIFSKTYCEDCNAVKQLIIFGDYEALAVWTGLGTVPYVFVKGKNVGDFESFLAMASSGELLDMFLPFPIFKYLNKRADEAREQSQLIYAFSRL
ncbi:Thioredoxin-like protein [Corchorus capsularis]|uniref:Thioredoxin-like protein n=1 Tax=Corchorus capsularis TaxID=210143 RepID=A0A1R3GPM6_COCAP|nr:Thioredoxin-like protein [Corchorus capsularis]